jgi:TonB family protein
MSKVLWSVLLAMLMVAVAIAQQSGSNAQSGDEEGAQFQGDIERVTDVQGADCEPYLAKVLQALRSNWVPLIPPEAKAPEMKSGKGSVEFTIMPDGKVTGVKTVSSTGDTAMDQAASGAITASQPFAPLPAEFHTPSLTLRFRFYYNPKHGDATEGATKPGR